MFLRSVEALHFVDFLHALEERHRISRRFRHLQTFFNQLEDFLARVDGGFFRSGVVAHCVECSDNFRVNFELLVLLAWVCVPGASCSLHGGETGEA